MMVTRGTARQQRLFSRRGFKSPWWKQPWSTMAKLIFILFIFIIAVTTVEFWQHRHLFGDANEQLDLYIDVIVAEFAVAIFLLTAWSVNLNYSGERVNNDDTTSS